MAKEKESNSEPKLPAPNVRKIGESINVHAKNALTGGSENVKNTYLTAALATHGIYDAKTHTDPTYGLFTPIIDEQTKAYNAIHKLTEKGNYANVMMALPGISQQLAQETGGIYGSIQKIVKDETGIDTSGLEEKLAEEHKELSNEINKRAFGESSDDE